MNLATNIHALLDAGLRAYGTGEYGAAERYWKRVLELQPDNEQAHDFLGAAGFDNSRTGNNALVVSLDEARQHREHEPGSRAAMRANTARLVKERKHEEALEELDRMRCRFPDDASVSRSIRMLRDQLVIEFGRRLGHLDQIPRLNVPKETLVKGDAPPEVLALLPLIDGIASLGDVVRGSHLGRFEAHRALVFLHQHRFIELYTEGTIEAAPAPPEAIPTARISAIVGDPMVEDHTFEALFNKAMDAYLLRDWRRSVELFRQCLSLRPGDPRAQRNLQCIRHKLE